MAALRDKHGNLRYFAKILAVDPGRVQALLEELDLTDQRSQKVASLSGGQRARVSLATALLGQPDLVVLDEPTVGLDPVLRRQLWETFRALALGGTTLLLSSHVMDEADHCDRLLLMRDGVLIADDSPAGLLSLTRTSSAEAAFLALVGQRP